jgi:hypothetical protein
MSDIGVRVRVKVKVRVRVTELYSPEYCLVYTGG